MAGEKTSRGRHRISATVMSRDTPLFEVVTNEEGEVITTGKVFDETRLPVCLLRGRVNMENVRKWLLSREVPVAEEGLPARFSVTDPYWVRYRTDETWEDGNFFENAYQTDPGRASFGRWKSDKRWVQPRAPEGDRLSWLIKAGSYVPRRDPFLEVIASRMVAEMNVAPCVTYELCAGALRFCSKRRNFADADTEFVPASFLYGLEERGSSETRFRHMVRMCERLNVPDAEGWLLKMTAADMVTGNAGRTFKNFGFLREVATGRILGPAPLMDLMGAFSFDDDKRTGLFPEEEERALRFAKTCGMRTPDAGPLLELVEGWPMFSIEKKRFVCRQMLAGVRKTWSCKSITRSFLARFPGRTVKRHVGTDRETDEGTG